MLLGRSYAFSVVIFIVGVVACLVFNVFKVHRACIQMKAGRLFFELIWVILAALLFVNIWTTSPSTMLYRLRS